jgi:hypothetical protein
MKIRECSRKEKMREPSTPSTEITPTYRVTIERDSSGGFWLDFPHDESCLCELTARLPAYALRWEAQRGSWWVDGDHLMPAEAILQRYFDPEVIDSVFPGRPYEILGLPTHASMEEAKEACADLLEQFEDDPVRRREVQLAYTAVCGLAKTIQESF